MTLDLPPHLQTIGLLTPSSAFVTFAWYAHPKDLRARPWIVAASCLMGAVYSMFRAA